MSEINNITLGQYLKNSRLERHISIEEIAGDTKINTKILENLENDSLSELPASAFVKGFIKSYCKYVGVDSKQAIMLYDLLQYGDADTDIDKFVKKDLVKIKKINRNFLWWSIAICVFLFLLGILIYFLNNNYRLEKKSDKVSIKSEIIKEAKEDLNKIKKNQTNESNNVLATNLNEEISKEQSIDEVEVQVENESIATTKEPSSEEQKVVKDPEVVIIYSKSLVWIKAQIDNEKPYDFMLKENKTKILRANNEIKIVLGDASAVKITYKNKVMDNLGAENVVKSIVFPGLSKWR